MIVARRRRAAVTAQRVIARNLIRRQQGAGFKMRRKVHRAQLSLQLGDRGGLRPQRVAINGARGEGAIETLLGGYDLDTERLSYGTALSGKRPAGSEGLGVGCAPARITAQTASGMIAESR
jgi:hypothetical protein